MIRFLTQKMLELVSDPVRLQPEYIEIKDTGDALSMNRVLHGLKRTPRGLRIVNKVFTPSLAGGASGSIPVGTILFVGMSAAPTGAMLCDGGPVSRVTYADLFTAIGETWGAGDGSTTFGIPDLRGRVPMGRGTGTDLTARDLADSIGEEGHQLTVDELASHNHDGVFKVIVPATSGDLAADFDYDFNSTGVTGDTGGDAAHNNIQPSLVFSACIVYSSSGAGGSTAYVPLDWYRQTDDPDWTDRELTLRFNLANARVLLEVF